MLHVLERIVDLLVVERVDDDFGDDVGQGHDHEGEEQQHHRVQDCVEGEGEQHHQTHPQDHRAQLHITPVDDVEHWEGQEGGEGGGRGGMGGET